MPRYFFHLMKGEAVDLVDEVGIQLDDTTVLAESRQALSHLVTGEMIPPVLDGRSFRIVDELGRVVAVLAIGGLGAARRTGDYLKCL